MLARLGGLVVAVAALGCAGGGPEPSGRCNEFGGCPSDRVCVDTNGTGSCWPECDPARPRCEDRGVCRPISPCQPPLHFGVCLPLDLEMVCATDCGMVWCWDAGAPAQDARVDAGPHDAPDAAGEDGPLDAADYD
jgi:hypothetical protein